ncbi:MAG TPA: hypothetical protein VGC07_07925 [Granulicella sp.]
MRKMGKAWWIGLGGGLCLLLLSLSLSAQQPPAARHRTRLYLKDHSYQIVTGYRIQGDRVLFTSAERDGQEEEIPLALVDFDATHRWEREHPANGGGTAADAAAAPASKPQIDPDLLKEEEERRTLTPEVATDLPLPEEDSVVVLDTFRGMPELVPMTQSAGEMRQTIGHSVLLSMVNPLASPHRIVELKGERAEVQAHVSRPVIYIRLGDEPDTVHAGTPFTVDTHGASSTQQPGLGGTSESEYVVVRTDVRQGSRVIDSFNPARIASGHPDADVVATATEVLPGGHWMKVTPQEDLGFGEYALMEVLSPKQINLAVWDFGVHPTAPENRDVHKPEPKKPSGLGRRGPD